MVLTGAVAGAVAVAVAVAGAVAGAGAGAGAVAVAGAVAGAFAVAGALLYLLEKINSNQHNSKHRRCSIAFGSRFCVYSGKVCVFRSDLDPTEARNDSMDPMGA